MFDDMLKRMNKGGKSEFFNQKQRARGETISLNKKNVPTQGDAKGKGAKAGKKKKKCC